jgi:hypothetical protein
MTSSGSSSWMIAISRRIDSGVSDGKPRIYPASVMMPCALQASNSLRYSVILFWRFFAAVRLSGFMFSNPMKTRVTPARFALCRPGSSGRGGFRPSPAT